MPTKPTCRRAAATAVLPSPRNGSRTRPCARAAVQPDAVLRELWRKRGGMRAIAVAALDRLVRNEPRVAAAAHGRPRPAAIARCSTDPGTHAERQPVERGPRVLREMKDELVAVVEEPVGIDRLVVADGQVCGQAGANARGLLLDGDRLDPVDGVLELEVGPGGLGHVQGGPRIAGLGADVQEQRPVRPSAPGQSRRSIARSTPNTPTRGRPSS